MFKNIYEVSEENIYDLTYISRSIYILTLYEN